MENNFKHTPGPWVYNQETNEVRALNWYYIAYADTGAPEYAEQEMANAKLIAAAPDLLECAVDAIELLRANKMTSAGTFMNLVVAVEKATGIKIDVSY